MSTGGVSRSGRRPADRTPRLARLLAVALGVVAVGLTGCAGAGEGGRGSGEPVAGAEERAAEPAGSTGAEEAATGGSAAGAPRPSPPAPEPRRLVARRVAAHPHDRGAYTQGLLYADGALLESTGRYGESELRRVDPESGRVMRRVALPSRFFAEGLARVPTGDGEGGATLIQLTWREGVALVWDEVTFERMGEHRYGGEGWGLCYDAAGERLVMSDGTPYLTFRDPATFERTGEVEVRREGRPLGYLNELECVDGRVYANVYGSETLVEIDPASGAVVSVIDASGLLAREDRAGTDVMNGIAHDPTDGTFLLTGKLWPKLFRVTFDPAE